MNTTEQSRYDLRVSRVMILTGINFCVMKKIVFRGFYFPEWLKNIFYHEYLILQDLQNSRKLKVFEIIKVNIIVLLHLQMQLL